LEDYRTTTTDAGGRFTVADLMPGSYRVYAERQGYLRGEYGRRTAGGAGVPVVLPAGDSVPGRPGGTGAPLAPRTSIVVPMIQTGVITGRVLGDDGRPVRNV